MSYLEQNENIKQYTIVQDYLLKRTQNVFVTLPHYLTKTTSLETFQDFMKRRYPKLCYYYSAYALMGLESNDLLVRGIVDPFQREGYPYSHGWVVFSYQVENYVYDSELPTVLPKSLYEQYRKPKITYQRTLEDILIYYTKKENCMLIDGNDYYIRSFEKDYQTKNDDTHLASVLEYSKITLSKDKQKVKQFIADYNRPFFLDK